MTATEVERALRTVADKERAKTYQWFFKTGKGEYGEGDRFLGVTVPKIRKIVRQYQTLSLQETTKLLKNPFHECRLTALLILSSQYEMGDELQREKIVRSYLAHTRYMNNWDLVDVAVVHILGRHLCVRKRDMLYQLARSESVWERRIAIVSTLAFIRNREYDDTIRISQILLEDRHDLIHKAVGWMLREVGKRSRPTLVSFLNQYAQKMPRTALRYAIEHFPEGQRKTYLSKKTPPRTKVSRQH